MELKVGMYVRTTDSGICRLYEELHEDSVDVGVGMLPEIDGFIIDEENGYWIEKEEILKASDDIEDLIEVGDFVNGHKVEQIWEDNQRFGGCDYMFNIHIDDIKSIVTKEQFEAIKYEIK